MHAHQITLIIFVGILGGIALAKTEKIFIAYLIGVIQMILVVGILTL